MNFWDKVLRLFGTNRVHAAWRWRRFKEDWNKPRAGGGAVRAAGLIPDEFPLVTVLLVGVCVVFYFLTVKLHQRHPRRGRHQPGRGRAPALRRRLHAARRRGR
jgi:hypothetical protein